ncbi:MAG TPA: hypothetical protein VFX98_07530 [Longimicrobiaceae bacterium]|nr:hypothetical protein [Longimicrobiaceae bacterium]
MFTLTRRSAGLVAALGLATLAAAAVPEPLAAQYFGRNKVQWRTFDFRVLRTPHFDVYFYPEEEEAARDVSRMVERWYARFSRVLDYEFESRQQFILYASHPHFQQTAVLGGEIDESTGGATEVFKQRIIMPMAHSYEETDHVVGHELVHAFQYDITGFGRAGAGLVEASQRFQVPGWFVEGMAEYLSVGPVDPHTSMWLRDAALTGRLPSLEQLTFDPRYFPYRWGQAFWAYIGGRWGDASIGQILKQVGQGVPYEDAFQRILNTPLEEIVEDWQTAIRRTYLPLLTERREAREEARPLLTQKGKGGRLNVAPSVSPDGRRIVFISELDFLDVELYVADAETGRVQRRLVKGTAFDPHFGSLRWINSSGTWSPDQRRFAFPALRKARDVVVVLDVDRARILREYPVPEVSEITNPTWSPDGNTIVFSGSSGGVTDLWALEVATGQARRLTDDRNADLHPQFSPDGRTVAFVRDPGTDFERLTFGNYQVVLMDLASGQIRTLPAMAQGRNSNPAWARDGSALFFISDRSGIPNVYRLAVASGELTQVTNLFTGVSGITDLSPAISSATGADRLVFAAYEQNGFNIYTINNPAELAGSPPETVQLAANGAPVPALLPPSPRPPEPAYNRVLTALRDPNLGLPEPNADESYAVAPYRARLSLDYLGQPAVGVSTSAGPYNRGGIYGGISGIFSDQLGYHTVYGAVQAQGQIEEIGFSTVYINRRNRWNWGVAAQRIPYIALGRRQVEDLNENVLRDQLLIIRLFDTSLTGLIQYPFSTVQRVEVAAGVRRLSQDVQIREYLYQPVFVNGVFQGYAGPVAFETSEEDLGSWNLGEAQAALVYDNTVYSYTSPFAGQRYRFEVSPTMGELRFVQATADYRRYFFLRPFTLAVRGYHFGRYGRDEGIFRDLFVGYPFLMRGYAHGSVRDACEDEIADNATGGEECRVLEQLFGTRVGVANLELRFPLFRQLVVGNSLGLPPIEGIAFLDAGSAWGQVNTLGGEEVKASPVFRRGVQEAPDERGFFTSGGVGARVNLFGYIIVEAVYVNAFDRPTGWHWEFAFQPGF